MKKILVVNGPNLNLLGVREPGIYGCDSLVSISAEIVKKCRKLGVEVVMFQSNNEGEIISKIHQAMDDCNGIILNAGAYTHYSYAIRDAIAAVRLPCIEVHLSNVYAREEFRSKSVIGPVCAGVISGFGKNSYLLAVDAIMGIIK